MNHYVIAGHCFVEKQDREPMDCLMEWKWSELVVMMICMGGLASVPQQQILYVTLLAEGVLSPYCVCSCCCWLREVAACLSEAAEALPSASIVTYATLGAAGFTAVRPCVIYRFWDHNSFPGLIHETSHWLFDTLNSHSGQDLTREQRHRDLSLATWGWT